MFYLPYEKVSMDPGGHGADLTELAFVHDSHAIDAWVIALEV